MAEFECRWASNDDLWTAVDAVDAQDAAERHAASLCERDNECYSAFEKTGEEIEVRAARSTDASVYRVTCEFHPTFCARRAPGGG